MGGVHFINLNNIFSVLSHEYDETFYVWNPSNWEEQVEAVAQGQPWLHREFEASLYYKTIFKRGGGMKGRGRLYI